MENLPKINSDNIQTPKSDILSIGQSNLAKYWDNKTSIKNSALTRCPKGVFYNIIQFVSLSQRTTDPFVSEDGKEYEINIISPEIFSFDNPLTHIKVCDNIDHCLIFQFMNGEFTKTNSTNNQPESRWKCNPLPPYREIKKVEILIRKYNSMLSGIRLYNKSG